MHLYELICSGDLVLDVPDPDHWLGGLCSVTNAAALTIGHLEVPHTLRGQELSHDVPAPPADPAHLSALRRAGFDAVTLGGNHIADQGAIGIHDTITELDRLGIAHCGAGMSLQQARAPAYLRCADRRVALLSYNCVGPQDSWATPTRAGCAYVRVDRDDGGSITPSAPLTTPDAGSVAQMMQDIRDAQAGSDAVIVALHKGIVHTPARLAPYERPLAQAAIDAGASLVLGHHAHILRGIELYRGRPIYHGLGNGCVVTRALDPGEQHPARAAWARRRRELFGFEPDPAYYLAPFHPEAANAMLAALRWRVNSQLEVGFVPVHIDPPGRPVIATGAQREDIARYISEIGVRAGLPALSLSQNGEAYWLR